MPPLPLRKGAVASSSLARPSQPAGAEPGLVLQRRASLHTKRRGVARPILFPIPNLLAAFDALAGPC